MFWIERLRGLRVHGSYLLLLTLLPLIGTSQLDFSQSFEPATITPGANSQLKYVINNSSGTPLSGVAFTDVLTSGLEIIGTSAAFNTCGGSVAVLNGNEIQYSGGRSGNNTSCEIVFNVTAAAAGTYVNISDPITFNGGSSGTSTATLEVVDDRPKFSKSFSPSTINFGERSTLTFTIDNSTGTSQFFNASFTDNLPSGMIVADPPNIVTTCGSSQVSAVVGSSVISLSPLFSGTASIAAGQTCQISVDVIGQSRGILVNVSDELIVTDPFFSQTFSSGVATASLEVLNQEEIIFTKEFVNDPYRSGGTGTLSFKIVNNNRSEGINNLAFSDDLNSVLTGLLATGGIQNDVCGIGSTLTDGATIAFSGGSLGAGEECSFSIPIQIPTNAAQGIYNNTSSNLSGTRSVSGTAVDQDPATDELFITATPVLTQTFSPALAVGGDVVILSFELTNPSTSIAEEISFNDMLSDFISGLGVQFLSVTNTCIGSAVTVFTSGASDNTVQFTGGMLQSGETCGFDLQLTLPLNIGPDTYTNITSAIQAEIEGVVNQGNSSTGELTVLGAPTLLKSFGSGSVAPGGTVDMIFNILHTEESEFTATDISFDDELDNFISGLTAGTPSSNTCGGSVVMNGSTLTFSGGQLNPGEDCEIILPLTIPGGTTSGFYTNTSSPLSAIENGITVMSDQSSADLLVTNVIFEKEFTNDPVFAGGMVSLEFRIANNSSTEDLTDIFFTDNLTIVVSGLTPNALPMNDVCGIGSSLTAIGNSLVFSGGVLGSNESCTFSLDLSVPIGAQAGSFTNTTSNLTASSGGTSIVLNPAVDVLNIEQIEPLGFSKSFNLTEAERGDEVILSFDISNSNSVAASAISFTDDLNSFIPGALASNPVAGSCGILTVSGGGSMLELSGAGIPANSSCTLSATVLIPNDAAFQVHVNETSILSAEINGDLFDSDAAVASLEVIDLRCVPEIVCPDDIVQSSDQGECGAIVEFDDATDLMDCGVLTITQIEGQASASFFSVGSHIISFESLNPLDNKRDTCSFQITVEDNTPPEITLEASSELWPPNGSYHTFSTADIIASIEDNCDNLDNADATISSATSDEPENGSGDGNTVDDIVISTDCSSIQVRSERKVNGNGRVYTVHIEVSDASGNDTSTEHIISVPKNNNGSAAIDDGPDYSENCSSSDISQLPIRKKSKSIISPNPSRNQIFINLESANNESANIEIFSIYGERLTLNGLEELDSGSGKIDVSELQAGTYYIVITQSGERMVESFIKI